MPIPSDLRLAGRTLLRQPSFTLLAVGTLGLGIGASTAIFSALYRLQIAPLPFETADRLVTLVRMQEGQGFVLSPEPEVAESWRASATQFEAVALSRAAEVTLTGAGDPVSVRSAQVTGNLPAMLGVAPLHGRLFTAAEEAARARVVLLAEGLWRSRFGADRALVGQAIRIGGEPHTVVGVMPERFAHHSDPMPRQQLWLPWTGGDDPYPATALGLLRAGVTLEAASAEPRVCRSILAGRERGRTAHPHQWRRGALDRGGRRDRNDWWRGPRRVRRRTATVLPDHLG